MNTKSNSQGASMNNGASASLTLVGKPNGWDIRPASFWDSVEPQLKA